MESSMENFEQSHKVGFMLTPENLNDLPVLGFAPNDFIAPQTILNLDCNTKTEDQGSNPWCAAYSAAMFAENILWRKHGKPPTIKEDWIYKHAKSVDGMPNVEGTTLVAALDALLVGGLFNPAICKVKVLRTPEQVKFAVHKFGACLLGMNITREWYSCNINKPSIYGQGDQTQLGGHAVVCCGYDRQGFYILNSWSSRWGRFGYAIVSYECFKKQFCYGAVLNNCLTDIIM